LAETINGLRKTELFRRGKRWRSLEEVEPAAPEWVSWRNERHPHEACGYAPPAEFEAAYYRGLEEASAASFQFGTLRDSQGGSDHMLSHWTQDDLLVNDVRLHYYRTGHGDKRPLVLVHGFSDNGLCWAPTARDLEFEYDVIMPDMRAHGLSARVQATDKVDMAADLAALIRTLGLRRPIVGGHSMGAMITFQIGVRFPELASALVLEDPPWWLSQPPQPHGQPTGEWAKELGSKTLEDLLAQYRVGQPHWPEELVRLMAESKRQLDPAIIDTLVEKVNRVGSDWLTTIQDIAHPMLLLTANPELGGIVTPEVVARVRQLNPRVTIVNVPDVGHLIRYDNYAAFMDALRAFLRHCT